MSRTFLPIVAALSAIMVGCTTSAIGPASGSAVGAQPLPTAVVLPNGATLAGGKFSEAQVDAMLACAQGKSGGSSVVTMLQQYKVANAAQRGLADPVIEKYAKDLGCL